MFYKKKLDNIQALQAEKRALKRKYAAFNAEEIVAKKEKKRSKKTYYLETPLGAWGR